MFERAASQTPWPPPPAVMARCQQILGHGENFPVLSLFSPRAARPHIVALYAYCRSVDDLGDESEADRIGGLERWEKNLRRSWQGDAVDDVVLEAAVASATRLGLPLEPYLDLIEANRRDQTQARFSDWPGLRDYCRHSADPVGRLYLRIHGVADPRLDALSDETCTGLQLVNFLQDIREDLEERGRIYLPLETLERYDVEPEDLHHGPAGPRWNQLQAVLGFERERARRHLERGLELVRHLDRRLGATIWIFNRAGVAVLDSLEQVHGDVWNHRPSPGPAAKARLVARGIGALIRGPAQPTRPTVDAVDPEDRP